jgi:phage-related protein (TIGR01555 family)
VAFTDRLKSAIARRFDGWFNQTTGVGAQNGRASMRFGVMEGEYLGLGDLENLYNFDGVCARVVDAVPEHALRQGFTVSTGESEQETALLAAIDDLHVVEFVRRAWTWGRLFGGGALLIGADDGCAPEEPLDESQLRRVLWLADIDRRDLYPLTWASDFDSPRFGQPVLYSLTRMGGTRSQTLTVHHTRLVRFEGPTPTRRRRLTLNGWGDSVLQRCYQEVMQLRGAFAASGELVQQASQGVIKMKGLMDMMASDSDDLVKKRLWLMNQSISVARAMLLDADGEDYSRSDAGSLGGVADIMDRMVNMVASVSKIPVTVLMGQAPAGLNATGDSDIRNWYDALASEREHVLRARLDRIVRLVLISREGPTRGVEPEGWRVVLPSLWQPTPVEEADIRAKQATIDTAYITAQVLTPEEVAVSRFRKEGYSTDTSIDLEHRQAMIEADATATPDDPAPTGADDAPVSPELPEKADGEGRYGHIDFTPPKGAQEAAARALEVRAEKPPSERGMTDVGIARARDLSNGRTLSPETVREMAGFFARHEVDKDGDTWGEQGPGWQAWHGWGGDAGYAWARKVVRQMDAVDDAE